MNYEWLIRHHAMRAEFHKKMAERTTTQTARIAQPHHRRLVDQHREAVVFLLAQQVMVQAYLSGDKFES